MIQQKLMEAVLLEGRIDDLKRQNPSMHAEIDSYAQHDPTPQKKFLPWLVSQHKKGNVSPDDGSISKYLSAFEKHRDKLSEKDHSKYSFQSFKTELEPHLNKGTRKEEKRKSIHEGLESLHHDPEKGIEAFKVKTMEAAQHVYGGGESAGRTNTSWCVAARSEHCLFEHPNYGPLYTIHRKNDPRSPYAVHPQRNIITARQNDGDMNIDRFFNRDENSRFPQENNKSKDVGELRESVDKIVAHENNFAIQNLKSKIREHLNGSINEKISSKDLEKGFSGLGKDANKFMNVVADVIDEHHSNGHHDNSSKEKIHDLINHSIAAIPHTRVDYNVGNLDSHELTHLKNRLLTGTTANRLIDTIIRNRSLKEDSAFDSKNQIHDIVEISHSHQTNPEDHVGLPHYEKVQNFLHDVGKEHEDSNYEKMALSKNQTTPVYDFSGPRKISKNKFDISNTREFVHLDDPQINTRMMDETAMDEKGKKFQFKSFERNDGVFNGIEKLRIRLAKSKNTPDHLRQGVFDELSNHVKKFKLSQNDENFDDIHIEQILSEMGRIAKNHPNKAKMSDVIGNHVLSFLR